MAPDQYPNVINTFAELSLGEGDAIAEIPLVIGWQEFCGQLEWTAEVKIGEKRIDLSPLTELDDWLSDRVEQAIEQARDAAAKDEYDAQREAA